MCRNLTFPLPSFQMNDSDISQFINSFEDFMNHAQVEELHYQVRQAAEDYAQMFYERKAAELEITVDYYIQEFI